MECVAGSLEEGQGCLHACGRPRRVASSGNRWERLLIDVRSHLSRPIFCTVSLHRFKAPGLQCLGSAIPVPYHSTLRCHEVHYTACTQTKPSPWNKEFSGLRPSWTHGSMACCILPLHAFVSSMHYFLGFLYFAQMMRIY